MEKNTTDSLPEIEAEVKQLKQRLEELEEKLSRYAAAESSTDPADFTDIELSVEELPEESVDDLPAAPAVEDLPEAPAKVDEAPVAEAPAKAKPRKPAAKPAEKPAEAPKDYPWLRDVPPVRVKNIRSAISLQDRALYINTLFKEDFQLYDLTISELNALEDAAQAAAYVTEHFPEWNLKSDIVYRFMMAVRKKLG